MEVNHTHVLNLPADATVTIRRNRHELFFRFMLWIVDSGVLARMRATTAKVYLALGCCADFSSQICRVSNAVLALSAGVSVSSVKSATRELVLLGLITKLPAKADRVHCENGYQLVFEAPGGRSKSDQGVGQNLTGGRLNQPGGVGQNLTHNIETESERIQRDTESQERAPGVSDSVSETGHLGVRASTAAQLVQILHVNYGERAAATPRGRQVRADLTTISRLIGHAVTAPTADDARRQAGRLLGLAREAASSCGARPPIAKLIHLARKAGLYPERATV